MGHGRALLFNSLKIDMHRMSEQFFSSIFRSGMSCTKNAHKQALTLNEKKIIVVKHLIIGQLVLDGWICVRFPAQ